MKRIVAGIVAHVDAGKTTLSEALLYRTGEIRTLGRVDHGDAFLDTNALEKARGITIFAHQALIEHGNLQLTLLDTPGHVDFAAETERALCVLDYAILVVSGVDGVQGHTETLWRLLARYHVPTFVFVNKCDAAGFDRRTVLEGLRRRLSDACIDIAALEDEEASSASDPWEELAIQDEAAMDEFLETGKVSDGRIARMIKDRSMFPVYFGSALKLDGVGELLDGLERFCIERRWPEAFAARVFKVSHDDKHNRLTWLRVTGGVLHAKDMIATDADDASGASAEAGHAFEKIDQVRVYNGSKFATVAEVPAGGVCAVTGPEHTMPGCGIGDEPDAQPPSLQPVLTYTVLPADDTANGRPAGDGAEGEADASVPRFDDLTVHRVLAALRELEDEDPLLRVAWVERLGEIHVQLMGAVQLEIIQTMMAERFGLDIAFGPGSILYRETITAPIEGVGHFEPLRHYAEVHILLEPGEPGSGVQVDSAVSLNELDRNWQRLIMTHMSEREHLGVLTGSPLTDVRMTLVAGKAHLKHTEGGDFRQATYRAIRQGLMEAAAGAVWRPSDSQIAAGRPEPGQGDDGEATVEERMHPKVGPGNCRVLEPWYRFRLEVPADVAGRAMSDIQRMGGQFDAPVMDGEYACIAGDAPVSEMRDYALEVNRYAHGRGRFQSSFGGYRPCHDEYRIIAEAAYDPESDLDNTPDSVFCAHGAGYPVKWYRVPDFMHLPYSATKSEDE